MLSRLVLAMSNLQQSAEYYKKNEKALYIETVKGKKFYLDEPEFDIEEIAHATGMQCRYTGHTKRFYSVAEHCIMVSDLVAYLELGDPFEGLMHDATEAYLSDIASPWKALLPDYKIIEGRLDTKMRETFKLPLKISEGVKRADWLALFIEARELIPSKGVDWIAPPGIKEQAGSLLMRMPCWGPEKAKQEFLSAYQRLRPI